MQIPCMNIMQKRALRNNKVLTERVLRNEILVAAITEISGFRIVLFCAMASFYISLLFLFCARSVVDSALLRNVLIPSIT